MLTGGTHFKSSWICSTITILIFLSMTFIPINEKVIAISTTVSILIVWKYQYHLEPYQSKRALKYKDLYIRIAYLWILLGLIGLYYEVFRLFSLGVLIQSITITPVGIKAVHKLNDLLLKGGGK